MGDIVRETEELAEKYKQQEVLINKLQEEIDYYKNMHSNIKGAVLLEESSQIIHNAKEDASEIINDALKRVEKVEKQRELLEKNMRIFKKKLRLIMEQQHIIIDKIDELEIQE